ncbi:MAG: aldehyde dehydrogenase family protein [Candidatus Dormibacteria bacterium]
MATLQIAASQWATDFLRTPRGMLIGGRWVQAASGKTITVINPATEEPLCAVPDGQLADVDAAVNAARKALEGNDWKRMRPADRERLLFRLADAVEADRDHLAELESLDNGKTLAMARTVDIPCTVEFLRYMAGWATKIEGRTLDLSFPAPPGKRITAYTRREPIGVVGAIIPWNFPLLMAVWKIGPALTTGCTVVLKPAEETPLTALRLAELVEQAGYPAGVLNVVTGEGSTAGASLASHKGINKLAFTGSCEVGKLVGHAAVENMTRFSLELGGKSPVIVLEDVDPEVAAEGAAQAIFFNHGQVCTAGSRLFVQSKSFDSVVEKVAGKANGIKLGPGLDPATQMGPLVSERQRDRVHYYIRHGVKEGARAIAGGSESQGPGFFVKPTVLVGAPSRGTVTQEEIFGPVLVAAPYDNLEDVAALANDTPYGLAASVWSNNLAKVNEIVPLLKAGTVWVNCHNIIDPAMPFGGYKQSGIGREMGQVVIDSCTELKSVCMLT